MTVQFEIINFGRTCTTARRKSLISDEHPKNTTAQCLSMTSQQKALGRYRSINQQFSLKAISRDTRHIHSVVDNLKHNPQTLTNPIGLGRSNILNKKS